MYAVCLLESHYVPIRQKKLHVTGPLLTLIFSPLTLNFYMALSIDSSTNITFSNVVFNIQ